MIDGIEFKPGSDRAIKLGCSCPVIDNNYGRGIFINGELVFWFNSECPIHGSKKEVDRNNLYESPTTGILQGN